MPTPHRRMAAWSSGQCHVQNQRVPARLRLSALCSQRCCSPWTTLAAWNLHARRGRPARLTCCCTHGTALCMRRAPGITVSTPLRKLTAKTRPMRHNVRAFSYTFFKQPPLTSSPWGWLRQFTSIPRAELAGLTAYVAQHRLPVGAADVAAAAAPRERAAPGAADGAADDDGDSEEAWPCGAAGDMPLLGTCTCTLLWYL